MQGLWHSARGLHGGRGTMLGVAWGPWHYARGSCGGHYAVGSCGGCATMLEGLQEAVLLC